MANMTDDESLATRLRNATAVVHRETENAPLVRALMTGELDRSGYAALLTGLLPVYRTLEGCLAGIEITSVLPGVAFSELARSSSIESDLDALGEQVPSQVEKMAERSDYVMRIRDLAATDSSLLVAHAYVRYMGDLSGGQILRRIVGRNLGLDPETEASFFSFPGIENIEQTKDSFRAGLDALDLDARAAGYLILEATLSFRLNRRLTDDVWGVLCSDGLAA